LLKKLPNQIHESCSIYASVVVRDIVDHITSGLATKLTDNTNNSPLLLS
jgi:hypothetical protein